MREKLVKYNIKLWEILFLALSLVLILAVGIAFKSSFLVVLNSVSIILTLFALAKGWILGQFIGLVNCCTYFAMSFLNRLYGEVILTAVITFPIYVITIISWLRHIDAKSHAIEVKKMSWREFLLASSVIAVLSVGVYFLLKHFNTAFLTISTVSTAIGFLASYMQMRRSETNFAFFTIANVISVVLWSCVFNTDSSYITTIITYGIQIIMNLFGFVNWIKLKKDQSQVADNIIMKNLRDL